MWKYVKTFAFKKIFKTPIYCLWLWSKNMNIFFTLEKIVWMFLLKNLDEILTNFSKNKKLGLINDENRNTVLQQFVAYVVKNLIEKIKILEKSEIIAVTQENIEVLLIYEVMSNIKNVFYLFKNTLDLWEKVKEKSLSSNQKIFSSLINKIIYDLNYKHAQRV